ncbi:ATP-binding cassette domain-containing protein [Streptantibioticus rubrisoli]|uniref:ATP-binding cassette domain-containing protein n=1 Tax=Streptantibioticus rubrisoli TaxID=1387313 RepID=A0ABT1PL16_9ACTN|nr:ATP-binding cassette domain-containing protein [Streptantibioticus rubrisoli]MCQ4046052.1 ATP-binding cassette domain-containing protein [Streptantibioticus rubrisoli]
MDTVVRVSGLTQGYGKSAVISGLDLDIGHGVFGLLGPNGAGKTTLLRTFATITPPLSGTIEIVGQEVTSERAARLVRRQIGYLPQDFGYHPGFSVYEFVRYCAWLREVPSARVHEAAVRVIDQVGLSDRMKAKMKSLSGGMVRRAGIAAALVGSPRLVLLDEPTVGLDPAQRLEFRKLIRSLNNTAVVLSTHLVEDVAAICREVAVMSSGEFLFQGSPRDLSAQAPSGDGVGDTPLERGYMAVLNRRTVGER